jgi:membrane protease YdiL (CAAX protease family)
MGRIIPEQLLLGIVVWFLLALLSGMVVGWIWALRRLVAGQRLLPERPLVQRDPIRWGGGTVLLVFVTYLVGNVLGFECYALATRGVAGARRAVRMTLVPGSAPQQSQSGKADQGPIAAAPEGNQPESKEPTRGSSPPARSTEIETDVGRFSLAELMGVQTAISILLVVLLPGVVRANSGAGLGDLGLSLHHWERQVAVGVVAVLIAAPLVYGIQLVVVNVFRVPPQAHPLEKMLRNQLSGGAADLAVLSAVIVAPLLEELLFRGIFQTWLVQVLVQLQRRRPAIARRQPAQRLTSPVITTLATAERDPRISPRPDFVAGSEVDSRDQDDPEFTAQDLKAARRDGTGAPAALAILTTSLFFAAVHGPQWPAPIALFVLSLAIGTVYHRTGSLLAAVCMHAVFNGLSMLGLITVLLVGSSHEVEKTLPPPAIKRTAPAERPPAWTAGTNHVGRAVQPDAP